MADPARYSPSSFLSLAAQEQEKREGPLIDIQQAGNFALKCEPSLEDQMTVEGSPSHGGVFYQNVAPGGFQQTTELARGGGEEGDLSGAEDMYRRQQQKMLGDGALESVLNQFYQRDVSSPQQGSLHGNPHIPRSQHPQAGSLGGSFQYSPAAVSPLTSPPPPLTNQQQETQRRPTAQRHPSLSPFVRVSSAGNLADMSQTPTRPPLERGKSEPTRHLQDKVRSLNAQHLKQMEELEKQKTIAEVQYSEILMQLLPKVGPSNQQQQVLQRVLSDPSLVKILRSVLLSSQPNQQQAAGNPPALIAPARPHIQPRKASASATPPPAQGQLYGQQQVLSPVELLSPTQVAMVN